MSVHSPRKRLALAVLLPVLNLALRLFHKARPVDGGTPLTRILVFRPDHIGDAIMATAVLRPLREKYPTAHIAMCVGPWSRALFEQHPGVDELIVADLPWWGNVRKRITNNSFGLTPRALVERLRQSPFDLFLDVRGDLRHILIGLVGKSRHIIAYNRTGADRALSATVPFHYHQHEVVKAGRLLEPLGIKVAEPALYLPAPQSARESLSEKLNLLGIADAAPLIVLCPQTRVRVKEWPDAHWQELTRMIAEKTPASTQVIAAGDKSLAFSSASGSRIHVFPGTLTLPELLALFERSELVIGSDSAPLHLAACTSTPIIALFGPTYPEMYAPFSRQTTVLVGNCVCNRDLHLDCDVNPGGTGRCMAEITPAQVMAAISSREILAR